MNKTRTVPTVSADHGWSWGWECWSDGGTLFERHRSVMKAGLLPEEWEEICDRVNDFLEDVEAEAQGLFPREYDMINFLYKVSDDLWTSYAEGGKLDDILTGARCALDMLLPFQAPAEVDYE